MESDNESLDECSVGKCGVNAVTMWLKWQWDKFEGIQKEKW